MDKATCWAIIDDHRVLAADLLEGLQPAEWAQPSLCDGWTVKDVGAHLTLAARASAREMLSAAVRSGFRFDPSIRLASLERSAARTPAQVVADLRAVVGSRRLAPGTFWRDPLLDVLVHLQDIARPLGRSIDMPLEAARVATDWAWQRRMPFHPARRLAGVRLVADDVDWARGDGAEVRGPIAALLLLSTGRTAALADVTGPGVAHLHRVA